MKKSFHLVFNRKLNTEVNIKQTECVFSDNRNIKHLIHDKSIRVFFRHEDHAALNRNPGPGYNNLILRLIPVPHTNRPIIQSGCPAKILP